MKTKSKVVAFPAAELPGLGIAATAGLGNRVLGSRNEIWICSGFNHHLEPVMLYVKLGLPVRAMMVEALAAQLAIALRLDCPTPYLVTVKPKHVGREDGPNILAFASLDVSERSMAKPIRSLETLFELMERLKVSDLACAFDEWIANDVRSPSDILISPESRVFLIDHEAAMREGLRPDESTTNWLAARLLERIKDDDRPLLLKRIRGRLAALMRVDLGAAPLAAQYSQDGVAVYTTLVHFLRERLQHLDQLLSERIVPEQSYLSLETEAPPITTMLAEDATR
jgi:hypothetical protein